MLSEQLCTDRITLFNFGLRCQIKKNKKHFENQTVELVRALPQDPKFLCDFTRIVSMLFSHMVADYRSFVFLHTLVKVSACKADIICIAQITLKEIYNVLLVDNWRFRFLSFKLIFDLVACMKRQDVLRYLPAKITKLLA